jgi:CHASE1-domain containing sensor protein
MKKLMLVVFAFTMLMSMLALAQDTSATDKQQSTATTEKMKTKAVALSGKVSDDGKMFVSDKDQTNWTVSNPDALKGHEGHEVTLKAHVDAAKNEIHVVSVKMGKVEKKETMK